MSSDLRLREYGGLPTHPADWRAELPEGKRCHLRAWFWSGAILTFLIVVVGGITRLTQSGLSIVDWNPIVGVVPPLTAADWQEAFARYQQFPEYRLLRQGMTLAEFRVIYLWEYGHRLLARVIGLVFLIPFGYFWARGYFNRPLLRRVLLLFGLGAAQGFMGWFMVMSGLVDDPRVSHFRLAAHLAIALSILSLCLWLVREMGGARVGPLARARSGESKGAAGGVYLLGGLLLLQILWGAFVAGLDAGTIFNTFPRMGDGLVPPGAWRERPVWLNLVENPATVQWVHRVLGTLLALAAVAVFVRQRQWRADADGGSPWFAGVFAGLVLLQYGLGIVTVLHAVPVALGALHQATAVVILGTWLVWVHRVREGW